MKPLSSSSNNYVSRDARQEQAVQKWLDNRLKGTFEFPTGFGKSLVAFMCIKRFLNKNPTKQVLIIVPNDALKEQWLDQLIDHNLLKNCSIQIINSAIKKPISVDLLVLDEIHKYAADTFSLIFTQVKYKIILGLTATLKRLDDKDSIIREYCPVIDSISMVDAVNNGWLSGYVEYKVLIETDLSVYETANKEFSECFAFFNNEFELAMKCASDYKFRNLVIKENTKNVKDIEQLRKIRQNITFYAMRFRQTLQIRKDFINNHPKKVELANLILSYRQNCKCITFSSTIKMAEQIKYGKVYSSKESTKKGRTTIEEYLSLPCGTLNTSKKLDEGFDCPDISVAILLTQNSSFTQKQQRTGRAIRKHGDKKAEIFTFVIKGTVEEAWFEKSTGDRGYLTISSNDLESLLKNEEVIPLKNKETKMTFRF